MLASTLRRNSLLALLNDYHDLAPPICQRLEHVPDALEMLRIIHAARPVIFQGFSPESRSLDVDDAQIDWTSPDALCSVMGNHQVSIAITPHGLADALHKDKTMGKTYFVQPCTEKMTFRSFFDRLADEENNEVHYLQSQNGNIYRFAYANCGEEENDEAHKDEDESPELAVLQSYIKPEVEFVSQALGRNPDAVNLWIGDRKSTTCLHKDPYENVYHLLSGSKTFRLFAPVQGYLLDTSFYPAATYVRQPPHNSPATRSTPLVIHPDPQPTHPVPWISLDPLHMPSDTPLRPIEVTVKQGETLFLPAGWYHHVMQEEGAHGICVAVNYWYDQTLQADQYAMDRYIWRSTGRQDLLGEMSDSEGFESE